MNTTEARIYVGTYAKYSNGDLTGKWLDLSDYGSKDEFLDACKELHSDEEDPELMFQDHEGIPSRFISESSIEDGFWEYLEAIKDMDEDRIEAFEDFIENGSGDTLEEFEEAYNGQFNDMTEFAEHLVEDLGYLESIPEHLRSYFDYDKFANDLKVCGDYWISDNGHVFRNI